MFLKTALVFMLMLISTSTVLFPVYGQDGDQADPDIGAFDIDKVYEDVLEPDTAPLFGQAGASPMRQPENYALVLLRIVGYLVAVTAIIFALAWGIRKFGVAGVPKVGGGNNMDVIETLYLGQNKGIALVRVGDIVYLLGHTGENIVSLEKIEGDKAIELIASSKSGSSIMSFKDAFNNFLGKMKR